MLRVPKVAIRLPYQNDHIFPPVLRVQKVGQLTTRAEAQVANVGTGSYGSAHLTAVRGHGLANCVYSGMKPGSHWHYGQLTVPVRAEHQP